MTCGPTGCPPSELRAGAETGGASLLLLRSRGGDERRGEKDGGGEVLGGEPDADPSFSRRGVVEDSWQINQVSFIR